MHPFALENFLHKVEEKYAIYFLELDYTVIQWYTSTMKHMHILVPDELYEEIRTNAFNKKLSMSQLVVKSLSPKFIVNGVKIKEEDLKPGGVIPFADKPTVIRASPLEPIIARTKALYDPDKYCPHMKKYKDCTLH